MERSEVAIVIPCYNEEKTIISVINSSIIYGVPIVIDDNSSDRTHELIKKLNGGVVDTKFPIDWKHYKNCVLLTQHDELKQLNTKIHKIIEV